MKILVADDEYLARLRLISKIKQVLPYAEISDFETAEEAYEFAKANDVDIAFLDIEMGVVSGMDLAKRLKDVKPNCNVIFCTGFSEYMSDAFDIAASDYLTKPISVEKIQHALNNLRHPIGESKPEHKLFVRCFGAFEVYWKGEPYVAIKNKAKELFAFLVDRHGSLCVPSEITEYLWEDCSDVNFRKRKKELIDALEEIGQGDVIINGWGKIGVAEDKILCDYYEFVKGSTEHPYGGEYMTQYNWAFEKQNLLDRLSSKKD